MKLLATKVSSYRHTCRNHGIKQWQLGLSLLELVVSGCVILVLMYALLTAIDNIYTQAERTIFEENRIALETALRYEAMSRVARGEPQRVDELVRENPFEWLEIKPTNYLGAIEKPIKPVPNSWYFDTSTNTVVYLPSVGSQITSNGRLVKELRLKIKTGTSQGNITLEPIVTYQWID